MSLVVPLEELFRDETKLLAKHESWERVELGEVCEVLNGFAFKSALFNKSDGFPVVRIRDLMRGRTETFYKGDYPREYVVKNGDLLVGMDGNFGCYEWSGGDGLLNQRVCKLIPSEIHLDRKFLLFSINGYLRAIQEATSSVTVGHLSSKDVQRIPLPLPSLNEQRRIVARLEKLLTRVDTARVRLATIPGTLKRFRQSVLAAACFGRLTADWRHDNGIVEPAAKLFSRIQRERKRHYEELCKQASLKGKRKPKNSDSNAQSRTIVGELPRLPTTWGFYRLDELSHLVTDGTHKTPTYFASGKPFLSVKNVRPFLIRDSDIRFISEEEHQEINSRCNPEKGDILYTKVGATFGYAAENVLTYPFSIFVSLALIKPVTPFFSSKFAELAMNSEVVFSQARERVSGIGTPDLHLVEIRDFRVPLPPLAEQQEIVRRVDALFKTADVLEARYLKAKGHVDRLTQSILAKAFRGELVAQDENDEPAAVLLERVLAERASRHLRQKVVAIADRRRIKMRIHSKGIFYRRAALDCYVIEKLDGDPHLGRTKIEKISHLLEHHCGIDQEREPIRDAAGPNDYPSRIRVESLARKQKWYSTRKREGGKKIDYLLGAKIQTSRHTAINFLGDRKATVDALLSLLHPLNTKNVEVVATLYASWNDFLLAGKTPTDDELIHDVRNNWHPTKQLIPIEWWPKTLRWMRRKKLIPTGTGKPVTPTPFKKDSPVLARRTRQTGTKSSRGARKRRA